jgi:CheY-like chemotaxis protein
MLQELFKQERLRAITHCIKAGRDGYLSKPIKKKALLEVVEKYLQ